MAIGFTAGIVPGPLLALFLSHTVRRGWRKTLPAVFAPLVSDLPIILLVVFILSQVPDWLLIALRIAGGVYLISLAVGMFRRRAEAVPIEVVESGATRLFRTAVLINLLNPNPYIFWGIALGPVLVSLGRTEPLSAAMFVFGFYAIMIGVFAGWVFLFGRTAALLPQQRRALQMAAGLAMGAFGLYQIGAALWQTRI